MSLQTSVMVGGITHLSDARYCAGMGVSWLGFPVGGSGLTPETYRQIIDWVSGPEFVLEIDQTKTDIETVRANFPGHLVQIGISQLSLLGHSDLRFALSLSVEDWRTCETSLDQHTNIQIINLRCRPDQLREAKEICGQYATLVQLTNGVSLEDVLSLSNAGVSLVGGREERPGVRDYSALADILERLEVE